MKFRVLIRKKNRILERRIRSLHKKKKGKRKTGTNFTEPDICTEENV